MARNTHGRICYIEIPTADITRSAAFYAKVFGWKIRTRGDGATAFDDAAPRILTAARVATKQAILGFIVSCG
jgi:predicted enzyme related to lactoylglutathione lyase